MSDHQPSDHQPSAARPEYDAFTLPGDIPDPAERVKGSLAQARAEAQARVALRQAQHERDREEEQARGYALQHPAGRGWVPPREIVHEDDVRGDPYAGLGHSGVFTRELRIRFLDQLAIHGNARAAAASAGVSHETAYRKRRQDARFAELWEAALVHARAYGESVLATRALEGKEVAIWQRGEIVGYRTVHDTRLLLAHLGRLDRRIEESPGAVGLAGRFDEALGEYGGQAMPEGFAEAAAAARDPLAPPAPAVPPTREQYAAWRRGRALDALEHAPEADEEGRELAELVAIEAADHAARAEWDDWHRGALANVSATLGDEEEIAGEGDGEGEGEGEGGTEDEDPTSVRVERSRDTEPPRQRLSTPLEANGKGSGGDEGVSEGDSTPLPLAGGVGGGPVSGAGHTHPPTPSRKREGVSGAGPLVTPSDPPIEVKSATAKGGGFQRPGTVSHPSTPLAARELFAAERRSDNRWRRPNPLPPSAGVTTGEGGCFQSRSVRPNRSS